MVTVPERAWWRVPIAGPERIWMVVAFLLVIVFFSVWMALWHIIGRQNAEGEAYLVDPAAYRAAVASFVERWKVGEESGVPVVAPPPGSDVYLLAERFRWYPVLRLKAGASYRLRIASMDVLHGFSLHPHQWSLQLYPGYEWVLRFTPTEPGEYSLVCNDYCGLSHQLMVGKIIVER